MSDTNSSRPSVEQRFQYASHVMPDIAPVSITRQGLACLVAPFTEGAENRGANLSYDDIAKGYRKLKEMLYDAAYVGSKDLHIRNALSYIEYLSGEIKKAAHKDPVPETVEFEHLRIAQIIGCQRDFDTVLKGLDAQLNQVERGAKSMDELKGYSSGMTAEDYSRHLKTAIPVLLQMCRDAAAQDTKSELEKVIDGMNPPPQQGDNVVPFVAPVKGL